MNARRKRWHSKIESLSNVIKYALKDRFEQKCFERGCTASPTSRRPTLLSCDTTSVRADAHIRALCNRHTHIPVIYVHILAANKFSPHSTITTFRTRQLKFLNGTFKSSPQSPTKSHRICNTMRLPSSFCRSFILPNFPPLTAFYAGISVPGMANE